MLREIAYRDPVSAFAAVADEEGAVLLDSAAQAGGRGRWSYICADPERLFIDPLSPFTALEQARLSLPREGYGEDGDSESPPFCGGLVGWLSYEAGRHLEHLPVPRVDILGAPECAFGIYDVVIAFDTQAKRAWLCSFPGGEAKAEALLKRITKVRRAIARHFPRFAVSDLSDEESAGRIRAAIDFIVEGDIFQANITRRWLAEASHTGHPWDLYRRLRQISPAPFAAFLFFSGTCLLSASPERFLRVFPDGSVETRPIKGTRVRGTTPQEDERLAQDLMESSKETAENMMIVDLLRNDLARSCLPGSIRVPVLCGLERFASVHHLVSVIEGRLRPGVSPVDLLRGSFPGGSITGVPKIRAMEIIHALEPCRRGPYCGSVFWIDAKGGMDSSIIIRSLIWGRSGLIAAQAGGGIVADSDPWGEVAEAKLKAASLLEALG